MKTKYLLLFITIPLIAASCRKSNQNTPVEGKWLETKVTLYGDSSGVITYDTTYTKPFTSNDYVMLDANGLLISGSDHYYSPNLPGYPKTPQSFAPVIDTSKYSSIGTSLYVISTLSQLTNPGGFVDADTIKVLNSHSLLIHSVFYSHAPGYSATTDSYYEK